MYKMWEQFISVVAAYHFVMVPARICYAPWLTYLDVGSLVTDIPADFFTMIHAVVLLNTAYKTRSGRWVTNRMKISSRASWLVLIAAIPWDWFVYLTGAPVEVCNWMRGFKLLLLVWRIRKSLKQQARNLTTLMRIRSLAITSASVIHILGCGWFYIGRNYGFWFPDRNVTWYLVDEELEDETFEHDLWGMDPGSTVWEKYLISFYWVASIMSANPMVGSVLPQNILEILYSMVVMTANLTLFRYVTGEVSALVMRADEDLAQSRSHLEGVDAFVKSNALPGDLQDEIRDYSVQQSQNTTMKAHTLLDVLSYALRVDVANFVYREHLENVDLFTGLSENLMDSVLVSLVEESFEPEDYLYREYEVATSMFVVVSGSIEEINENVSSEDEDQVTQNVRPGGTTADVPFFFKMRHWQSAKASRTQGAVVLRMPRDRLSHLLKMFPEEEETLAQNAMEMFHKQRDAAATRVKAATSSRTGSSHASSKGGSSEFFGNTATEGHQGNASMVDSSMDGESDKFDMMFGGGLKSKVATLSARRRADAVNIMCTAAASGDMESLQQLINDSARPHDADAYGRTPLHVAASNGNTEACRLLLTMNADPAVKDTFQNTPLNDAVREKHDETAALIRIWDPDAPPPSAEALKKQKMGGGAHCRQMKAKRSILKI